MLSFSTCWNRQRHKDGEALVEELLLMGIDTIELGHALRITQIEGILRVVERGDVRISSVHNFCPHPIDVTGDSPDCFECTSHRESDRQRFLRLTRETMSFAARVGAGTVVLHGGRVRTMRSYRQGLELIENGQLFSKAYGQYKIDAVRRREAGRERPLARLQSMLDNVLPLAEELNLFLGLENRERYEDIPSEREMLPLLNCYNHPHLGYWHDFGHAQIKHHMAFLDHPAWFREALPRLVGCHVHDVRWPNEDHQAPFTGEVDFDRMVPLLPPGVPVVFEIHPDVEKEAVTKAWKMWQERYAI
jgi:sugar phosphate isomerase/epimerase